MLVAASVPVELGDGGRFRLRVGNLTAATVRLGPAPPADAISLIHSEDPDRSAWLAADRLLDHSGAGLPWTGRLGDADGSPLALMEVTVEDSTVGVTVTATAAGAGAVAQDFVAAPGERWCGFGERSDRWLVERGVVEWYVGEGPYQPEEYEIISLVVLPWALRDRRDASYFPLPWVLSTAGYGLLVETDEVGYARFRTESEDRWSVETGARSLSWRMLPGPSALDALACLGRRTGRQPAPERWWFGPWYQTGHANHVPLEEEHRQLAALRQAGAAASAAETHCRYLPLGEDRGWEADERARTAHFHSEGLAVLGYLSAFCGEEHTEAWSDAVGTGALQRRATGEPYTFDAYVGDRQPPIIREGQYDFAGPAGGAAWGRVASRLVDAGYDGWMEDFGEYTALDALGGDGSSGTGAHNRYPTQYHGAAAEQAGALEGGSGRRLARFVRSGWTGTAAVAPVVWGGDPTCGWGFDGLASAVVELLSMAASGVSMWGSDTGGFFSGRQRLDAELLVRWIQFSSCCPVMRTKSSGVELPHYRRPQIWDDDIAPQWAHWSVWHTRLNDYLMAAHATYRTTGRPIACPLPLLHAGLPGGALDDEYLLGPDLLVAPVLAPGASARPVTFPPGTWIDLWNPSRPPVHGPARLRVAVSAGEIPVWLRGGAVLALLAEEVRSLSPYAPAAAERRDLWVFPMQPWEGSLGPGLDAVLDEGRRGWMLSVRADRPVELRVRDMRPDPVPPLQLS